MPLFLLDLVAVDGGLPRHGFAYLIPERVGEIVVGILLERCFAVLERTGEVPRLEVDPCLERQPIGVLCLASADAAGDESRRADLTQPHGDVSEEVELPEVERLPVEDGRQGPSGPFAGRSPLDCRSAGCPRELFDLRLELVVVGRAGQAEERGLPVGFAEIPLGRHRLPAGPEQNTLQEVEGA